MKSVRPIVSVLLPVGKDQRFLKEALESIWGQTFKDYELLTQEDDGRGITRTLIDLAKKSKGEFLARMDADDVCESNRFKVQVKYLQDHPDVQLVGSWATLIDGSSQEIGLQRMPTTWDEIKKLVFYRNPLIHPSWMMRKNWYQKSGGYDQSFPIVQDWDLLLRRVWRDRIENIPQPLIKLRIHRDSYSFVRNRQQVFYGLKARFFAIVRGDVPKWKMIYLLARLPILIVSADIKLLARKLLNQFQNSTQKQILGIVLPIGQNRDQLLKSGQWGLWQSEIEEYQKKFDTVELFEYRFNDWRRFPEAIFLPFTQSARFKRCLVLKAVHLTGSIPCLIAKLMYKKPFVLSFGYRYDEFALIEKKWFQWILIKLFTSLAVKTADLILVSTEELKAYVEDFGAIRIVVIPNGVDTRRFAPSSKFQVPSSKFIKVLFVGRLERQKNLSMLIKAVAKIKGVDVLFVGSGSQKQELLDLANKLKVKLEIKSSVDNNLLPAIYNQANIFVLPSLAEGHPKVLLEAMSCGLACMASNISGVKEIIVDGKNGLLVEPTVKGIASGLEKLVGNLELRKKLGIAARLTIIEKFDKKGLMEAESKLLLGVK